MRPSASSLVVLSVFAASSLAAQQAVLVGRVTDASTGQPPAAAQVSIVGTNRGTLTNSQGFAET
jgi:hypothetical protein